MSTLFEIWGRTTCVWCDRAKELLVDNGFDFKFLNVETEPKYLGLFKKQWPSLKTVPQIVFVTTKRIGKGEAVTSEHIGGYTELVEWLKHYTKN